MAKHPKYMRAAPPPNPFLERGADASASGTFALLEKRRHINVHGTVGNASPSQANMADDEGSVSRPSYLRLVGWRRRR